MIGKPLPFGRGFLGLARYLEKGHAGEERERAEWVETRNLPTEDPETAARLMAAWARESVRTLRPVYHVVISADPGDPVDRRSLSRVADTVLRELGLSEHQALIIAHNDTAHPHMHLVVNRVHPKTHRAWENSWDWPKIEKALTEEEVSLGWRIVPKPHARVPGQEPAPELQRGDAAFLQRVKERGGPVLVRASTWAELEDGLAAVGLHLRVKGGGLSFHDGRQEVKASDVDRLFSRGNMEKRLGKLSDYRRTRPAVLPVAPPAPEPATPAPEPPAPAPQPAPRRDVAPRPAAPAADATRAPDPPAPAPQPAPPREVAPSHPAAPAPDTTRAPEPPAPAPQPAPRREVAPSHPAAPAADATRAPEPPTSAPQPAPRREVAPRPAAPAADATRAPEPTPAPAPPTRKAQEPARNIPAPAHPRERSRFRSAPPPPAPPTPEERFYMHANRVIESQDELFPEVVGAAELVYESRAWFAFEPQLNAHVQAAEEANEAVAELARQRERAEHDAAALREVLARIYTNPESAARTLMAYQRKHGKERVRDALRDKPQEFGTLRRENPWWGLGFVYSTATARDAARDNVADPLDKAVRSEDARPGAATERAAKERAREARRVLVDAREKRRALRSPQTVEQEAAALLVPLARQYGVDWVTRELVRLIPPEDREAAEIALRIVSRAAREFLDRSRGRERDRGMDFF